MLQNLSPLADKVSLVHIGIAQTTLEESDDEDEE